VPHALREPLQKRLSMYVLRAKVKASDASADHAQFGIAGPDAQTHVAALFGDVPAADHAIVRTARGAVLRLPLDRYLIVVPAALSTGMGRELAQRLPLAPESEWNALDIAAGIATIVPETQELFVPQMVNLDALGGVSYSKGCYPGQEIVARMHYLGRLKERMYRARIDTREAARPGDKIYGLNLGDQAAGTIANALKRDDGRCDVLAVVQLSSVTAGEIRWRAPDGPKLILLDLPYSLPEK
jgi:folate-binding protein YgfZ